MHNMDLQKQIRENNQDLRDFLRDLETWESEAKEKEKDLRNRAKSDVVQT